MDLREALGWLRGAYADATRSTQADMTPCRLRSDD